MKFPRLHIAQRLSLLIAILAGAASLGGLLLPGLYRDTGAIREAWYVNDAVTLFLVLPLLGISLLSVRRGSLRAQPVWMGTVGYMFYNYAFYLFGAAFNSFFLLYTAIFTLSVYALALGLSGIRAEELYLHFREDLPVRSISIYLLFLALPLLAFEGGLSVNFIFTGRVPEPPSLIFALDLSFVVPNSILAGLLLWRRRPWGYILGVMMLVKGFAYGSMLSIATIMVMNRGLAVYDPLFPFYIFVAAGSALCLFLLLRKPGAAPASEAAAS